MAKKREKDTNIIRMTLRLRREYVNEERIMKILEKFKELEREESKMPMPPEEPAPGTVSGHTKTKKALLRVFSKRLYLYL